jgi:drug/metabolite transporter (DMT)-like permease
MIYLLISILLATFLVVILKFFVRWEIPQHFGIVFNYGVCMVIGWFSNGRLPGLKELQHWEGTIPALTLGVMFFSIFNIIAVSSKYIGIGITSIAFKISFIIPVVAAVMLYHEPVTWQVGGSVICALGAVLAISIRKQSSGIPGEQIPAWAGILPIAIFVGSGLNDAFLNYIQVHHLNEGDNHLFNAIVFTAAFLFGFLLFFHKKKFWRWRYLAGGLVLGIPNYGSIYFLLLAMQQSGMKYSLLFPAYNLGIILTGVALGRLFFGEKLDKPGYLGLLLAVLALIFIALAS